MPAPRVGTTVPPAPSCLPKPRTEPGTLQVLKKQLLNALLIQKDHRLITALHTFPSFTANSSSSPRSQPNATSSEKPSDPQPSSDAPTKRP